MPRGTYRHLDPDGSAVGVEVFSCAPGPAGWRYLSRLTDPAGVPVGEFDVTVDADWRQLRVHVGYGGWSLRGGVAGADAIWVRAAVGGSSGAAADAGGSSGAAAAAGAAPSEVSERAVGFTGSSPGFLVATARLLRLGLLDRRRVRLVAITAPAALPLVVEQGWALVDVTEHAAETGPLPVERYEVADLATAERRIVHLAGDVVLDAPGIELVDLESPPNLAWPSG